MRLANEKKQQWLDRIRLRSWNSDGGNFTVKARFLREDDQAVYLKKLNGQEVTVEKDRLSEKDKRWIKLFEHLRNSVENKAIISPEGRARLQPLEKFKDVWGESGELLERLAEKEQDEQEGK